MIPPQFQKCWYWGLLTLPASMVAPTAGYEEVGSTQWVEPLEYRQKMMLGMN